MPTGLPAERSGLAAMGLPANAIDTIQTSRASSTRDFYYFKCRAFEHWCQSSGYCRLTMDGKTYDPLPGSNSN